MSLGKVKEDHDKKGDICKVVDAVLNPKVIEAVLKDVWMLQLMEQLLLHYINEKYKIELAENFIRPKLNYKGKSIEF